MKKGIIIFASIILAFIIMVAGFLIFVPEKLGVETHSNLPILYEVKSDKTEFIAENVTLDFYYGARHEIGGDNFQHKFVGFALFFFEGEYLDDLKFLNYDTEYVYKDYRKIDGLHLIKELTYDEFNKSEYRVTQKFLWIYDIPYRETLTIPKAVFERDKGSVIFMVIPIYYNEEKNGYHFYDYGAVLVDYEYIGEDEIRITKPSSGSPR